MLLATLQVGIAVLCRGIIIGIAAAAAISQGDGDEFLILHLLRNDEGGVAGKGGSATGQRAGSSQFLGSNGAHIGTAGGGNPCACGGSFARGCGVAAREGEVAGIADNYALYGGGIGGGFGIHDVDDYAGGLVIESQAIVRAAGGLERDVRRRGVEEIAALVARTAAGVLVGLHRPRYRHGGGMALTGGCGAVAEVPGGDGLRFAGRLPVERGDAACRLQGDTGIATAGRGILLDFRCAAGVLHLHGYRITAAPLPVGSGGTRSNQPVHLCGEGHGVLAGGQRGAVVVRQVAARGGEQGEAA